MIHLNCVGLGTGSFADATSDVVTGQIRVRSLHMAVTDIVSSYRRGNVVSLAR